jgi:hypothetical protein
MEGFLKPSTDTKKLRVLSGPKTAILRTVSFSTLKSEKASEKS